MSSRGVSGTFSPMPSRWLRFSFALCAMIALVAQSRAQVMPADETGATGGGVEMASYTSSGSYFNRELGTPLRFGYHSEGYGTDLGVVSLGTMPVFNLDGAAWFLDAQGTMSDDFGGGFNAGIGYRELVNMSHGLDPDRILGASFWTDGQSTKADNFFTQLGFGLESLGESFDLRMNGYFPLDRTKSSDPTIVDIDTIRFMENGLFAGTTRTTTDTAYSVLDAEAAKRIGNLDAWALAAVYHLGGGEEAEDATGYRVGLRGYAVPDLLVGVEVTEDDIYDTNVMATLTWFVGRTHKGNAPIGTIVDRFREPVMRNNFIATTSSTAEGAGIELTDADTDDFFDFLHVDADAAAGGDGTFENPFNTLEAAALAQQDGSYIFVHANDPSVALTPATSITLLDNVKFWGEGTNEFGDVVEHAVDTVERGSVFLPETSPGAQDFESPTINVGAANDFLVLADNNDVNNFRINGGVNTITGTGVNAPQLANLDINTPTGTGISFTGITGTAVVDNTVTITDANRGMLIDGGSAGMNINARITNAVGTSLEIVNRTGGTIAYGGSIQDDNAVAATDAGIIIQNNDDATINFTQVIGTSDDGPLGIDINSGNFNSLFMDGNDEGTIVTFADLIATAADADTILFNDGGTLTINDSGDESLIQNTGTGNAFTHVGSAVADEDSTITVAANINNSGGGAAVNISNHTENNITFSGEITDTGAAGSTSIVLTNNTGGTIAFNDRVNITGSDTANGVAISGGGADVNYTFTDIGITLEDGTAFSATGDGTLVVTSADDANDIQTAEGQAININGLAIGAGNVTFDTVTVTNGTQESVFLQDLDGDGQVILGGGDDPGDGGSINNTAGTGITVDNADSVVINNIDLSNSSADEAMLVINQDDGATLAATGVRITATGAARGLVVGETGNANLDGNTATFTELTVTAVDGDAVTVEDNTGGTYIFNDLTATTTGSGDTVFIDGNSDDTVVTFNDMTLTSNAVGSTGRGFVATNGGEIAVTGDTAVSTRAGSAVVLNDVTVSSTGAQFDEVNVIDSATAGVSLTDVAGTGQVAIGSGAAAGDGGTIGVSGAATGIEINNANSVAVTGMTINKAGTGQAALIVDQDGGSVSFNDVAINSAGTANGLVVGTALAGEANTDGTVTFNDLAATSVDGDAVSVIENDGGTYIFNDLTAEATGTGDAVFVNNNSATTEVSFNGMTVTSDSGNGFVATNGGTITATGTNAVTTASGVGVTMADVTIGSGVAFNSVNVTAGATNGIVLTNTTGGTFRVGAATATDTDGNGGTLTTAGDAIVLTGASNAVFNDIIVDAATGIAADIDHTSSANTTITFDNLSRPGGVDPTGGNGIALTDSGIGELHFILRNSGIDTENTGDVGYAFDTNGTAGEVNISLINNTINSAGTSAVAATIDDGTGDIQFLMLNNTVANSSAANATVNFAHTASRTLNATIGSQSIDAPIGDANSFTNANPGSGTGFAMSLNNGSGITNLDLRDNTASGATEDFVLTQTNGTFGVVDLNGTTVADTNNAGTVNTSGTFINLSPPIKQPD